MNAQYYLNLVKEKRIKQNTLVCPQTNVNSITHTREYVFHCSGLTNNQWRHLKSILHHLNGDSLCDPGMTSVRLMSQIGCLSRTKIPGPQKRIVCVHADPVSDQANPSSSPQSVRVVTQMDQHVMDLLRNPRQFGLSMNFIFVYAQTDWGQLNHVESVFVSHPNVRDPHKAFTHLCTQWLSSPLDYLCRLVSCNHFAKQKGFTK